MVWMCAGADGGFTAFSFGDSVVLSNAVTVMACLLCHCEPDTERLTSTVLLAMTGYVEPVGFSILCFGFSMIMSRSGAPAGIMGNTLSSLMTSASMTHGPSS